MCGFAGPWYCVGASIEPMKPEGILEPPQPIFRLLCCLRVSRDRLFSNGGLVQRLLCIDDAGDMCS